MGERCCDNCIATLTCRTLLERNRHSIAHFIDRLSNLSIPTDCSISTPDTVPSGRTDNIRKHLYLERT